MGTHEDDGMEHRTSIAMLLLRHHASTLVLQQSEGPWSPSSSPNAKRHDSRNRKGPQAESKSKKEVRINHTDNSFAAWRRSALPDAARSLARRWCSLEDRELRAEVA